MTNVAATEAVHIELGPVALDGDLHVPVQAAGLVIFAHGGGSSRFSRRNRAVAKVLEHADFGTLLLDLRTQQEEAEDERTAEYRFNIPLLGERVVGAADWAQARADLRRFPIALFGASTGGRCGPDCGGRPSCRDTSGDLARRSAGSCRGRVVACRGADPAHRRRRRHAGDRQES